MQHETDALTVVVYSVCAVMCGGLSFIIWHMYSRVIRTQDAFLEALSVLQLEQVKQNYEIKNNHEHLVRLERVQNTHSDDLADKIITKLRAISGSNHVGNMNGNGL